MTGYHTRPILGAPILEEILPVQLKSKNRDRGKRFFNAQAERKKIKESLYPQFIRNDPFDFPVAVMYTRITGVGEVVWDNDNLAAACKELQDTLTEYGWWHDDSNKWIRVVAYRHELSQREVGPAVMVSVFRLSEERWDE